MTVQLAVSFPHETGAHTSGLGRRTLFGR
jgi:hypothetical protein